MNTKKIKQNAGVLALSLLGACSGDGIMNPVAAPPPFKMSLSGGLVTIFQGDEVSHFAKAYTLSASGKDFFNLDFRIQANSGDVRETASLTLVVPVESDSGRFPAPGQYVFGPVTDGMRLGSFSYAKHEGPLDFVKLKFNGESLSVTITSSSEHHLSGLLSFKMAQAYGERMIDGVREEIGPAENGESYASVSFELEIESLPEP